MAARTLALVFVLLFAFEQPCGAMMRGDFARAATAHVKYRTATVHRAGAATACSAFNGLALDGQTTVTSATFVPASGANPAFCDLLGTIAPQIAFEVALPAAWNERLYVFGNGGYAGELLNDPSRVAERNAALEGGFAAAQTNTGHYGGASSFTSPSVTLDYGYAGIHLTTVAAREAILNFYGLSPSYAYFSGCSDGGREGLMEAQRFPDDFDGIEAGAPFMAAVDTIVGMTWTTRIVAQTALSATTLSTIAAAVMNECDALDGLRDGIINDPRRCSFDARTIAAACPGYGKTSCVTSAEAIAYNSIISGTVSRGAPYFPGYAFGSENAGGWLGSLVPYPVFGPQSAGRQYAGGFLQYMFAYPQIGPYDAWATFDFNTGPYQAAGARSVLDALSTNLSAFAAHGGKMITYTGWADALITPYASVGYYENALAANGLALASTYRLFMVPGMGHCGGGAGLNAFDTFTPLVDWVESGTAPDVIPAYRVDANGNVLFSRPLCAYPNEGRYTGGNPNQYASFACEAGLRGSPVPIGSS